MESFSYDFILDIKLNRVLIKWVNEIKRILKKIDDNEHDDFVAQKVAVRKGFAEINRISSF